MTGYSSHQYRRTADTVGGGTLGFIVMPTLFASHCFLAAIFWLQHLGPLSHKRLLNTELPITDLPLFYGVLRAQNNHSIISRWQRLTKHSDVGFRVVVFSTFKTLMLKEPIRQMMTEKGDLYLSTCELTS